MTAITEQVDAVLEILDEDIAIHERWAAYQRANADWAELGSGADVGDPEHHEQWAARYHRVRSLILELAGRD